MYDDKYYLLNNRLISRYQLAKLHTFEAAARHCSFALAAEELCLSPSAVSHQITKLESELHFKLFHRYHRRIELTQDGENLFNVLKQALATVNQEILEIKSQELTGTLTIYSRPSVTQGWLIPKLPSFTAKYPYITLNLLTGNEVVNFNRHRIDLAIYYDELHYQDLDTHHLFYETIIPVCSPNYANKYKLNESVENLGHCMILHDNQAWGYDSNFAEWETWQNEFNLAFDFSKINSMRFDRSDLAAIAAINHIGIAMGRLHIIEKYLASGELIMPFSKMEVTCSQRYYMVTPQNQRNPKVNAFLKWASSP